jgi:hypothetical protein
MNEDKITYEIIRTQPMEVCECGSNDFFICLVKKCIKCHKVGNAKFDYFEQIKRLVANHQKVHGDSIQLAAICEICNEQQRTKAT